MHSESIINVTLSAVLVLFFTYFILSIITTNLEEIISEMWNRRGRELQNAIAHLLGDPRQTNIAKRFFKHPLIIGLLPPGINIQKLRWLKRILPIVAARHPSYIPSAVFADAIIDILTKNKVLTPSGNMKNALKALWIGSDNNINTFRTKIIECYDAAMERQNGRYKRTTQRRLFFYGLFVAIVLNISTVDLVSCLLNAGNANAITSLAMKITEKSICTEPSCAQTQTNASQKDIGCATTFL
ncbi:hypothetical protein CCP2SC5_160019 [Azospirillaceae bacterium]